MTSAYQQTEYGYHYGLRQPGYRLHLTINSGLVQQLETIDQHLSASLDVTLTPMQIINSDNQSPLEQEVAEIGWRILLLASSLLRAVKAPLFDPGKIISVARQQEFDNLYSVQVAIPWLDRVITRHADMAYHAAQVVIERLGRPDINTDAVIEIQNQLHENVIKPSLKSMPGGESTVPVLANAFHKNIPFRHLNTGIYLLGWGKHARMVDRSAVEADSVLGSRLCNNKMMTASLLRNAGLPAPQHLIVRSEQEAIQAALQIGWPVVVKPVDLERGEGVVVDIEDNTKLLHAYRAAAELSQAILVEKQVAGICHRIYVSHGEVLYANTRLAKAVTGDGKHTIAELIEQLNLAEEKSVPWRRLKPFPNDAEAIRCLNEAGLEMSTILAQDKRAYLRRIEATAWGGISEDCSDTIHPHNRDIAIQAASLFGLDSAGIDLITTDISMPWYDSGAIINEVNFSPLIGSHRNGYKLEGALAHFIENLIDGDGRIPVEVFIGSTSQEAATERQRAVVKSGLNCYMTSHNCSRAPSGDALQLAPPGLFAKCNALLLNRSVESLMIAIETDELLTTGLPVDRIDQLTVVDNRLKAWSENGKPADATQFSNLLHQLESCLNSRSDNNHAA